MLEKFKNGSSKIRLGNGRDDGGFAGYGGFEYYEKWVNMYFDVRKENIFLWIGYDVRERGRS